jgi:hypothetical protein
MRDEGKQSSSRVGCEACGTAVPAWDVVHYGSIAQGYRDLCTRCFNAEVARAQGLERFENVRLQPVVMTDCAGESHEFHFQRRLLGSMAALEAFELTAGEPGGYQFAILGKPEDDLLSLLGRLIERMRRSLSVKHLTRSEHGGMQIADRTVCGRIGWDASEDGDVPLLVIDGQEVSWGEFGRMLMSFEGWQFRVAICDRSEEV